VAQPPRITTLRAASSAWRAAQFRQSHRFDTTSAPLRAFRHCFDRTTTSGAVGIPRLTHRRPCGRRDPKSVGWRRPSRSRVHRITALAIRTKHGFPVGAQTRVSPAMVSPGDDYFPCQAAQDQASGSASAASWYPHVVRDMDAGFLPVTIRSVIRCIRRTHRLSDSSRCHRFSCWRYDVLASRNRGPNCHDASPDANFDLISHGHDVARLSWPNKRPGGVIIRAGIRGETLDVVSTCESGPHSLAPAHRPARVSERRLSFRSAAVSLAVRLPRSSC